MTGCKFYIYYVGWQNIEYLVFMVRIEMIEFWTINLPFEMSLCVVLCSSVSLRVQKTEFIVFISVIIYDAWTRWYSFVFPCHVVFSCGHTTILLVNWTYLCVVSLCPCIVGDYDGETDSIDYGLRVISSMIPNWCASHTCIRWFVVN